MPAHINNTRNLTLIPYHVEIDDTVEHGGNTWNTKLVGIYDSEGNRLGEYNRGYPSFGISTFYPFERDGNWYALYSSDYTSTYVMSLPSCEKIAQETEGFCPVEYWVPRGFKHYWSEHDIEVWYWDNMDSSEFSLELGDASPLVSNFDDFYKEYCKKYDSGVDPIIYADYGFVSGCFWGDDTSWKLEVLDLRKVNDGIISRVDILGYHELPDVKSIRDIIEMDDSTSNRFWGRIGTFKRSRFDSKLIDESIAFDKKWKSLTYEEKTQIHEEFRKEQAAKNAALLSIYKSHGFDSVPIAVLVQ